MMFAIDLALGAVMTLALAAGAEATVLVIPLGTAAPAPIVGGLPIGLPAIPDPAPLFVDVTSAPIESTPFSSLRVLFNQPMNHRRVGQGWDTWSHGYTGDVYSSNGATSLTMTFNQPQAVIGFHFYVESAHSGPFTASITVTSTIGPPVMLSQPGSGGGGAVGFGMYDPPGFITSITVNMDADFAIGEFGVFHFIPVPGVLPLLAVAGLVGKRRRR